MIQDFSVDNFLSFGSRQEITFEASSDNTSEASLVITIRHPKSGVETRLLCMSAIYGANASGKTNLLRAIADVWAKMYHPHSSKDDKITYHPFDMRRGEDTEMSVSFYNLIKAKYTKK